MTTVTNMRNFLNQEQNDLSNSYEAMALQQVSRFIAHEETWLSHNLDHDRCNCSFSYSEKIMKEPLLQTETLCHPIQQKRGPPLDHKQR